MAKNILLVEDDYLNRRLTKKALLQNNYHVLEVKNCKEALELLNMGIVIDLAIVDINLGEGNQDGTTLGKELLQKYAIPFIYLTAYDTHDIIQKAVATVPHSYITKPFKNIDLLTSVELAIRHSLHPVKNTATTQVKDGEYNLELPLQEICYIVSEANYLLIHTKNKVYKKRSTIKQILEHLPEEKFIQTHRAFVVNKDHIHKFNIHSLVINNTIIPISKNYVEDLSIFYN